VEGIGHPGAEDRDREGQRPVGGGDVTACPELPGQGDGQQAPPSTAAPTCLFPSAR
jgi:hypothetical protein